MRHKVTLIAGEGIGPEVAAATRRVIDAAGVQIEWEELAARTDSATEAGQLVNQGAIDSVRRNHVALKGPTGTAIAGGAPSVNVALRKTLDLYANLRPVKNLPGVKSRFENVDIVLVRENTEDLYSGLEHEVVPGVVESLKIITERASQHASPASRLNMPSAAVAKRFTPSTSEHHEAERRLVPEIAARRGRAIQRY